MTGKFSHISWDLKKKSVDSISKKEIDLVKIIFRALDLKNLKTVSWDSTGLDDG